MFICAVSHITNDLQDAYKYIELDLNLTTTPLSDERVFTSAAVENLVVRRSGFIGKQVQQVNKFFRKWYACLQGNRTEFGVNVGRKLESYVRQTGYPDHIRNESHRDFAGIMARSYPYFSNVYHGIVPQVMSQFRHGRDNASFLDAFFNAIPRWYFTQTHLDYVNLLHEVLRGRKDAFLPLACTNRFNETVVIPYARGTDLCPSFSGPYQF